MEILKKKQCPERPVSDQIWAEDTLCCVFVSLLHWPSGRSWQRCLCFQKEDDGQKDEVLMLITHMRMTYLCGYVRHLYPLQKKNNIIGHIQIYSCKGNSCHVTNVAYTFSYTEKCFVVCGIRGQCSTDVVGLNVCYPVTRTHQTMELMTQGDSLWFCPSKAWMGVQRKLSYDGLPGHLMHPFTHRGMGDSSSVTINSYFWAAHSVRPSLVVRCWLSAEDFNNNLWTRELRTPALSLLSCLFILGQWPSYVLHVCTARDTADVVLVRDPRQSSYI